jgi:hypothetical protein
MLSRRINDSGNHVRRQERANRIMNEDDVGVLIDFGKPMAH